MNKDKIKQDIIDNIEEDSDIDELLTELFRKKRQKSLQGNGGAGGGKS